LSDEARNAYDLIQFNREFDSNEIDESDLQREKTDDSRSSTFRGISSDSSDDLKMHRIQFEAIVNLI
jgi:hypothetical protein